jgi:xanthine/CO dehydrogenase XdhC/CoxF family maturation factor
MKDDGLIVAAWAEAVRQNVPAILATVVKVSGSAYRSPGARMLITETGARTGSISGGCLEGDVLKKAWWLTGERRAAVRVYDNSSEEEAIWEFGLGCNGVVHVLLERWDAEAKPLTVELLAACQSGPTGGVLASVIGGEDVGEKSAIFPDGTVRSEVGSKALEAQIDGCARAVFESTESRVVEVGGVEVFVEYVAPPLPLLIVGAGQDALPLVRLAKELGWQVTVVDGHSNQARPERFPLADRVLVCDPADPLAGLSINRNTCAVVMSHSYSQDEAFVRALLPQPIRYLGVLGPRKRTDRMLSGAGGAGAGHLHSPVGLDIGADSPEEIALSIVSEIKAALTSREGGMLRRRTGPIHDRSVG